MRDAPGFLTADWILTQFDRSRARAIALYRNFVKQGRDAEVWAELRGGILIGTDEFVANMKPLLSDYETLQELPRRERLAIRPSLEKLFSGIETKAERNEQIHAAIRVHQHTLQAVADFLGLHYATVSKIAKRAVSACHCPH